MLSINELNKRIFTILMLESALKKSESKNLESKKNNEKPFYIIGIGSSAGGLKALEEFFDNCPSDTGFAFVIVQHLSPHYKSLMPELLSRHTKMSVKEAKEGDTVMPNHVYLIPGAKNIQISEGKLELTKRLPNNQVNFSIDIFFNSLAKEQKERALAIILSGTGSDGTKGAKSIKEVGGTVFVQSPNTSGFDGMPKSAISQGLADYILSPNEMGNELVEFVSHPEYAYPVTPEGDSNNLESLGRILKIIKSYIGYDFFSYKKPTLLRRTAKRINITKCQTVENYIDYLHDHPEEKFLLTQEYLIGVTKFFRDSKAFEVLQKEVIPNIISKKTLGQTIKIWTVACSTGEEAYSIAILIEEHLRKMDLKIDYKIFATDLDDRGIDIATKGIYDQNIESELPPKLLSKYFIKKENKYQIHPIIRKNIIFSKHDILQNPPFNKMDLVSCRNMLIYMENDIQLQVLSSLHYALNHHGYLFLGSSENLGILSKNFEDIDTKWKIYKNIQPERLVNISKASDVWKIEKDGKTRFQVRRSGNSLEDKIAKSINKLLMDELLAVSVCIDENFEIIHASGKLKKYIQYPDEGYSNNLLKMLPDELNIPISTSVRKLSTISDETIEKTVKLIRNDKLIELRLLICAFNIISVNSRSFLITIIEESDRKITKEEKEKELPKIISNVDQVIELKEALNETRENLQSTIEELETSNEEMQATNEELLASNEELQSTNEELQSLNEELHTVNAELQTKNVELIELNSDIENLMTNINVGTIFLDRNFHIRKFTPSIREHFSLQLGDIGRSITHFSGTIGGEDLTKHAKEVIRTLQPFKKEVVTNKGNWFALQIFPYRSQEDSIKGVVINFIDIHNLKQAVADKEKLNSFLTHLTTSNPAIIYILDLKTKKNLYANANLFESSGYSPKELKDFGDNLLEKIIHPDDLDIVLAHFEKLKTLKDGEELQLEYRFLHKDRKTIDWVLSTDKVNERDVNGEVKSILGVAVIVTKAKKIEQQLRESEERNRLAISSSKSGLWEWSNLLKDKAWWSKEFYTLLGYTKKQLKPLFSEFINLVHPNQIRQFREGLESHVEGDAYPFEMEVQLKTSKNDYKWFKINAQASIDINNNAKKIVGTIVDINEQKEAAHKMKNLNTELERFAYLASHDLKEPLRTVTSFTKLFKEEYVEQFDDNALQYLDFIEQASSRMITLTNDLLVYSQLDDKSLNFSAVNLNEILDNIILDLKDDITRNNATININQLPSLVCDSSQINQLFQNLISNSLKYRTKTPPIIEVSGFEKPSSYEFHVKDNGIGIEKKYQSMVFDVFKRLHTKTEYEGTGIGLANCKRIVDNHKGKIWIKSSLGKGATFIIAIPKIKSK